MNNESSIPSLSSSTKKQFNDYEIELKINEDDSLNIVIKNNLYFYESNFSEKYLQKQFNINESINNIYNNICDLIDKKEINIKEEKNNLQLMLKNYNSYIILIIEISSKYLLEKINEINNKMRKKDILIIIIIFLLLLILLNVILFSSLIINTKNKINNIENLNIKNLNTRIHDIETYKIIEINNRIKLLEKNNLTDLNMKIDSMMNNYNLIFYQFTTKKLTYLSDVENSNSNSLYSLSFFSSGNMILKENCYSFQLYDKNLNKYQKLNYQPDDCKYGMYDDYSYKYIDTYKDSFFTTCYEDGRIIIWNSSSLNSNNFTYINDEYDYDSVMKVIFTSKGDLISCSLNGNIKIWYLNNKDSKNITLKHINSVNSILLLEDKNILVSSGVGIKFWNLTNNNIIFSDDNVYTNWNNGLDKIDDDNIIICNNNNNKSLIIFSISKLKSIKIIDIDFECYSIRVFKNKGIFLVGGRYKVYDDIFYYNIYVYLLGNYELLQTIEKAHNGYINGFAQSINNTIVSYSLDSSIKTWLFE